MVRTTAGASVPGLSSFRRGGAVTQLLFLYECLTEEPTQLRPIADRLGVTVQAASHSFRQLAGRGLAELRNGHYRPTVAGVQWLHSAFGSLREDLNHRWGRLDVIRFTRAIAVARVKAGEPVVLELRDGVLSARPGTAGASHGRAVTGAPRGGLLRVEDLEGILPIPPGRVRLLTLQVSRLEDPRVLIELKSALAKPAGGLLAAQGLEAYHLLSQVTRRPVVRFGVASACLEAARVGVDSTVLLLDEELPRFLEKFAGPNPVPLTVAYLGESLGGRSRSPRRRSKFGWNSPAKLRL